MISKFINIMYFIPANKIVCVFSNGSQEWRFYWKHFGHVVLLPTVLSANREPAPPKQFSLASPLLGVLFSFSLNWGLIRGIGEIFIKLWS